MRKNRTLIMALVFLFLLSHFADKSAHAQDTKINGMQVVALHTYIYKTKTGPLLGLVVSLTSADAQTAQPVSFIVCNTGKTIQVNLSDLQPIDRQCPNRGWGTWAVQDGGGVWAQWTATPGKLVVNRSGSEDLSKVKARFRDIDLKDINVSDLPTDYQKIVDTQKSGGAAAITLTYKDTPILGILPPSK
jgi:hypothetical protein